MSKAWQVPGLLQILVHGTCVGNGVARHVAIDLGEGTISAWQVGNSDQFAEATHEYRVGVDREGAVDLGILFRANQRTRILVAARAARVNVPTDEVILLRIVRSCGRSRGDGIAIAYREGAGARHVAHHTAICSIGELEHGSVAFFFPITTNDKRIVRHMERCVAARGDVQILARLQRTRSNGPTSELITSRCSRGGERNLRVVTNALRCRRVGYSRRNRTCI